MTKDERFHMRASAEELDAWRTAADELHLDLSAWVRLVCNTAAGDETLARVVRRLRREKSQ